MFSRNFRFELSETTMERGEINQIIRNFCGNVVDAYNRAVNRMAVRIVDYTYDNNIYPLALNGRLSQIQREDRILRVMLTIPLAMPKILISPSYQD